QAQADGALLAAPVEQAHDLRAEDLVAEELAQLAHQGGFIERRARAKRVDVTGIAPDIAAQVEKALPARGCVITEPDLAIAALPGVVVQSQLRGQGGVTRLDVEVEGDGHDASGGLAGEDGSCRLSALGILTPPGRLEN